MWPMVADNAMEVSGGDIVTKDKYQDFKLHLEFMTPNLPDKKGQAKGNRRDLYPGSLRGSGGSIPTAWESKDDDCGAIYKQKAPAVNACKPPEQWQTYDITFALRGLTQRQEDRGRAGQRGAERKADHRQL
jgi:hypothetical protein